MSTVIICELTTLSSTAHSMFRYSFCTGVNSACGIPIKIIHQCFNKVWGSNFHTDVLPGVLHAITGGHSLSNIGCWFDFQNTC